MQMGDSKDTSQTQYFNSEWVLQFLYYSNITLLMSYVADHVGIRYEEEQCDNKLSCESSPDARAPPNGCCPTTEPVLLSLM